MKARPYHIQAQKDKSLEKKTTVDTGGIGSERSSSARDLSNYFQGRSPCPWPPQAVLDPAFYAGFRLWCLFSIRILSRPFTDILGVATNEARKRT